MALGRRPSASRDTCAHRGVPPPPILPAFAKRTHDRAARWSAAGQDDEAGPWTTVYFTEKWDVGPGETASLPTKWMSADGRTVQLVFSGDDYFAVREARLRVVAADTTLG